MASFPVLQWSLWPFFGFSPVSPVLLQVQPEKCWEQWDRNFFISGYAFVDTTQQSVASLCSEATVQTEIVFLQDPQVSYPRASPQSGKSQTTLQFWINISQVEQWQLNFVELHNNLVSPLFQPVYVFLQGEFPFQSVHFPSQFGIISKLLSGFIGIPPQITYEEIKCWAQSWSLGTPLVTGWNCETDGGTTTLWVLPVSQFPTHCTDHFTKL